MAKRFKISDYQQKEIRACNRILLEIVNLLGEYRDHVAVVGGWVPFYLIPQEKETHMGTIDVDLAFDFQNITGQAYENILEILTNNNYVQKNKNKPFQWWKDVEIEGEMISVELDLLGPEYGGRSKRHENQRVQDIKVRKARGSDLIFSGEKNFEEIVIEGHLPGGAKDSARCKVAGVVPFLVMKGMALGRGKPKDAYDIEYVVRNYPGGINALVEAFKPNLDNKLVKEGLGKIRAKFESVEHVGPRDVAEFFGISEPEDLAIRVRAAFENVNELLEALEIEKLV